jgi:hypothetical protein
MERVAVRAIPQATILASSRRRDGDIGGRVGERSSSLSRSQVRGRKSFKECRFRLRSSRVRCFTNATTHLLSFASASSSSSLEARSPCE